LLKEGIITDNVLDDDAGELVLTIRMVIDDTLQPKWVVTNDRDGMEDKEISNKDRALFNMFMIADYADNHFAYSRFSPLYALLKRNMQNSTAIDKVLLQVVREAYNTVAAGANFQNFEITTDSIKEHAKKLGLDVEELRTILEYKENAYTESNITLHDGNVPYSMHGKGSKRLLSIAIQMELATQGGIILIDELEQGLEPDRIVNLMRILKNTDKGQIFVTTHSSYVLVEANYNQLLLTRKGAHSLYGFDESFQPILRSQPEVFFSKKIICCEGKTEQAVLRSIDERLRIKEGFAVKGISVANGRGGDVFYQQAIVLKKMQYDVCVFADNDVTSLVSIQENVRKVGISVIVCDDGLCLEQQLYKDMPWDKVLEMLQFAIESNPDKKIMDQLKISSLEQYRKISEVDQLSKRELLGKEAKKNGWYKDFSRGEYLGKMWADNVEKLSKECTLYKNYNQLIGWINGSATEAKIPK